MAKNSKRRKSAKKQSTSSNATSTQKNQEVQKNKKSSPSGDSASSKWILTGLAAIGSILAGYLALSGWVDQSPVLCSEGSSCDIVQQSRWGTFLSLPIAFWGFLTYAVLFYISIRVSNPKSRWKAVWTVSLLGWVYSVYLISVSTFVIQALCFYCIASFVIMSLIFGLATFQRPKDSTRFNFSSYAKQGAVIAAFFVGGMHLHYSGFFDPMAGPEDPYLMGLAEHLNQKQVVLYGAYW